MVVVQLGRYRGIIYKYLEDYEMAIQQNQLALNVLRKNASCGADLLKAQFENSNLLYYSGRHQEAIDVLKGVVSIADTDGKTELLHLLHDQGLL